MKNVYDATSQIATLWIYGQRYVFDLTNVARETVLGSEASLREAVDMLGRAITLKPLVEQEFLNAKVAAYRAYWSEHTPSLTGGKKSVKEFNDVWRYTYAPYVEAEQARNYVQEVIDKLSKNYIPRLRVLTGQTLSGERYARAGESAQPRLPEFPPTQPPSYGAAPGAR